MHCCFTKKESIAHYIHIYLSACIQNILFSFDFGMVPASARVLHFFHGKDQILISLHPNVIVLLENPYLEKTVFLS